MQALRPSRAGKPTILSAIRLLGQIARDIHCFAIGDREKSLPLAMACV